MTEAACRVHAVEARARLRELPLDKGISSHSLKPTFFDMFDMFDMFDSWSIKVTGCVNLRLKAR